MGVYDYTLYNVIERNAKLFPDLDCFVFNDDRVSFKDYKTKCDHLAAGLIKAGIKTGDRVGVLAQNSVDYMILYGAAAKLGVIVLAVNWRFQQEEVEFVINDCTPRFVFAGADFQKTITDALPKVKSVEKCFTIGAGDVPDGFTSFDDIYTEDGADEEYDISGDNGFVIIHTAAVEGEPRGALLSQLNSIYAAMLAQQQYNLSEQDCHIGILPLFHVAGLNLTLVTMLAGGKNVIMDRFDPALAVKLIDAEKGSIFFNFAPILSMILEAHEASDYDISSVKHVSGLDNPETIMKFLGIVPGATYYTGFGQTEVMGVSGGKAADRPGSAGRPGILAQVKLFDDYDIEVPVGTPGEICVRSPTVFLGYWGREKDNAYTFRNGWHHTGDIARFDEDGFLWYVKRKAEKELIKPGGENVYPNEVEKTILENDAVAETCVIGVPDKKWGEAIKAICVLEPGKTIEVEELIEFVGSKIARYKKPQQVVFVDSLPKGDDGETDRDKVKKDHGAKY